MLISLNGWCASKHTRGVTQFDRSGRMTCRGSWRLGLDECSVWLHKTYCRFSLVLSSGKKNECPLGFFCLFVLFFWIDLVFVEKLLSNLSLRVCQINRRENIFVRHLVTLKISMLRMLSVFLLRTSTKPEGQALSPEQALYLLIFILFFQVVFLLSCQGACKHPC